jgi:hypothetical protein
LKAVRKKNLLLRRLVLGFGRGRKSYWSAFCCAIILLCSLVSMEEFLEVIDAKVFKVFFLDIH